jgi:hypothetical protein
MIQIIYIVNGIYDILCGLTILQIITIPILSNLHLSIIQNYKNDNPIFERFFAYWIITYGVMRLSNNIQLIWYSYFIETFCFTYEYIYGSVNKPVCLFVILSSFCLTLFSGIVEQC